eukprot:CAMPEP_0204906616 /NCGR_PEP_ID=MMETSP1397-20131031/6070_1 /ASSEMBLY_ACC=CAM_ASM_000891 /TAXON_ID=49980 /ORGANISM="Climacostomum Climacostomum virens, Strain Stock W-24" /LENGTH=125 /DNA_ID=CAMNT_0052075617 /DNA_START=165 /DNA_END=542 /DNA_ORIENTATION=+
MTRRMLNAHSYERHVKPLTEPKALEAGVEFLGEFAVYATMLGLGFYELNKVTRDSRLKEAKMQRTITDIQHHIGKLESQYFSIYSDLHKLVAEATETVSRMQAEQRLRVPEGEEPQCQSENPTTS